MKQKHIIAHMKVAHIYGELSTCERLKVGCIIVKNDRIISIGYNGTPAGDSNCCEDKNNQTKSTVIHAEMNALMKLSQSNESSKDATMFITHAPCIDCAKLVYQAGIRTIYYSTVYRSDRGINFLHEHDVDINTVNIIRTGD